MGLDTIVTKITVNRKSYDYAYRRICKRICGHFIFEIAVNYWLEKPSVWVLKTDDIDRQSSKAVIINRTKMINLF